MAAVAIILASLVPAAPASAATLVVLPAADAHVDSSKPSAVYGAAQKLKVATLANRHEQRTYLIFDVTGVGAVTGATLRLFTVDGSDAAGTISVTSTSWTEADLTWSSAPAPGAPIATIGPVAAKRWAEIDLGSVVTGPGRYAFVIHGASTDAAAFHSRQAAKPPILTVSHDPLAPATPVPESTPHEPTPTPTTDPHEPTPTPTTDPHEPTPEPVPTLPPPTITPDRETCQGYPEARVFLEAQDWWQPIPGIEPATQGHVHVGMCFPLGQTVSGSVDFDIRVVLHDNLGVVNRIKMQDDTSKLHLLQLLNIPAPEHGALVHWQHVTIDTTQMLDGVRLFRWYVDLIHANGNRQTARTGWPVLIDNGLTDTNVSKPTNVKFSGWYQEGDGTEWGYLNADLDTPPLHPISGIWQPKVSISNTSGPGVTSWRVAIDPDFHHGNAGLTVASGFGAFSGTITVDTSSFAPGAHRLVMVTTATIGDEDHSGVAVIPFHVASMTVSAE